MKHINIAIAGRVQGVGFRNAAKKQAWNLEIKGFVSNRADGTVYIEAEGEDAALADFVKWCRLGPPFAQVDQIDVSQGNVKYFTSFETVH